MRDEIRDALKAHFPFVYWRGPLDRLGTIAEFVYERLELGPPDPTFGVLTTVKTGELHTGDVFLCQSAELVFTEVRRQVGSLHYFPRSVRA